MRLFAKECIVRDCTNPTPAGFRRCPQCMRGNIPSKREATKKKEEGAQAFRDMLWGEEE